MYRADPQGTTRAVRPPGGSRRSIARAGRKQCRHDDPSHPRFSWMVTAPHCWHGFEVHRSGTESTTPTTCIANSRRRPSSFVIHGLALPERRPASAVLRPLRSAPGTGAVDEGGRPVLGSLTSDRMQIDPDGSFTITVDSEPADGRPQTTSAPPPRPDSSSHGTR